MKTLQLSLKAQWFEMTKALIKREDYREINDYWCRRFLELDEETEYDVWNVLIEDLVNPNRRHESQQGKKRASRLQRLQKSWCKSCSWIGNKQSNFEAIEQGYSLKRNGNG